MVCHRCFDSLPFASSSFTNTTVIMQIPLCGGLLGLHICKIWFYLFLDTQWTYDAIVNLHMWQTNYQLMFKLGCWKDAPMSFFGSYSKVKAIAHVLAIGVPPCELNSLSQENMRSRFIPDLLNQLWLRAGKFHQQCDISGSPEFVPSQHGAIDMEPGGCCFQSTMDMTRCYDSTSFVLNYYYDMIYNIKYNYIILPILQNTLGWEHWALDLWETMSNI